MIEGPARTLLHLAIIPGMGPAAVQRLLNGGEPAFLEQLYQADVADFVVRGLAVDKATFLVKQLANRNLLEAELAALERTGSRFVPYFSAEYPALLRQMRRPPLGLFVRGQLPTTLDRSVAFVGSRQANQYAQQVIEEFVPVLVGRGWHIVSGGALGADSFAHAAAVTAASPTIAVLGSGLAKPYPSTNRRLFDAILATGGALVSPFPTLTEALPANFVARNGVIAGMARASIVVQAARKSGALITAAAAAAEGREVGVVPGSIFDPLSAGCHELLATGATPVTSALDILRLVGEGSELAPSQVDRQLSFVEPAPADPLLSFCKTPRTIDALVEHFGSTEAELYARLWELQIAGSVQEVGAGRWQAARL